MESWDTKFVPSSDPCATSGFLLQLKEESRVSWSNLVRPLAREGQKRIIEENGLNLKGKLFMLRGAVRVTNL